MGLFKLQDWEVGEIYSVVFITQRVQVPNIEGPWSQKPLRGWVCGTRVLRYWVLGPSALWLLSDIMLHMVVANSLHHGSYGCARCSRIASQQNRGWPLMCRTTSLGTDAWNMDAMLFAASELHVSQPLHKVVQKSECCTCILTHGVAVVH